MRSLDVVIVMTFDPVPAATLIGGSILFDADSAQAVFAAYADWTRGTNDQVSSSLTLMRFPDMEMFVPILRGRTVLQLELAHIGAEADADAEFAGLRD